MVDERERLTKLIAGFISNVSVKDIRCERFEADFADYLLYNGVTLPVRCEGRSV